MNFHLRVLIVYCVAVINIGCEPEVEFSNKENEANEDSILITSTKVCGWVPNYDSIAIDNKGVRYYNLCMANKPVMEYPIPAEQWSTLKSTLNLDAFKKIDLNMCNICADGCDMSISVKTNSFYHYIKFNPYQVPDTIKDFVENLQRLRASAKEKACG